MTLLLKSQKVLLRYPTLNLFHHTLNPRLIIQITAAWQPRAAGWAASFLNHLHMSITMYSKKKTFQGWYRCHWYGNLHWGLFLLMRHPPIHTVGCSKNPSQEFTIKTNWAHKCTSGTSQPWDRMQLHAHS